MSGDLHWRTYIIRVVDVSEDADLMQFKARSLKHAAMVASKLWRDLHPHANINRLEVSSVRGGRGFVTFSPNGRHVVRSS